MVRFTKKNLSWTGLVVKNHCGLYSFEKLGYRNYLFKSKTAINWSLNKNYCAPKLRAQFNVYILKDAPFFVLRKTFSV